jgi:hypothetical protein
MPKEGVEELIKKLETESSPYKLLDIAHKLGEKGEESKSAKPAIESLMEKFGRGDYGHIDEWEKFPPYTRCKDLLKKMS